MMFVVVIGKLKHSTPDVKHPGAYIGCDKVALIEKALAQKKEWESHAMVDGTHYGPYDVWVGELTGAIEPVRPVVEYREVSL